MFHKMNFSSTVWAIWLWLLVMWCNEEKLKETSTLIDWDNEGVIWRQLSDIMISWWRLPNDTLVFQNSKAVDSLIIVIWLDVDKASSVDDFVYNIVNNPVDVPLVTVVDDEGYKFVINYWPLDDIPGAYSEYQSGLILFNTLAFKQAYDIQRSVFIQMVKVLENNEYFQRQWWTDEFKSFINQLLDVSLEDYLKVILRQEIRHLKKGPHWTELWSEKISANWWSDEAFYYFRKFQTITADYFNRNSDNGFDQMIQWDWYPSWVVGYEWVYGWYMHALIDKHPKLYQKMREVYQREWRLTLWILLEYWVENPEYIDEMRSYFVGESYKVAVLQWLE